jgi:DNA-binding response OmpR family regulator
MYLPLILVACPDPPQSKAICDCLKTSGYRVQSTGGGKSALEILQTQRPVLVVLDHNLPDLDCLALIRKIRSENDDGRVRIILIGSDMKPDEHVLSLEAGADLCLAEPFQPRVFVARVRALLRRGVHVG